VLTTLLPIHISGNYQISVFLSSSLDTFYLDDTLKTNYVVNKISLPYDVDFSTTPAEFIFKQITGTVNWNVVSGAGVSPVIAPVYGTGRLEFASSTGLGSISQAIINGMI
jgi:hypothetical protein